MQPGWGLTGAQGWSPAERAMGQDTVESQLGAQADLQSQPRQLDGLGAQQVQHLEEGLTTEKVGRSEASDAGAVPLVGHVRA